MRYTGDPFLYSCHSLLQTNDTRKEICLQKGRNDYAYDVICDLDGDGFWKIVIICSESCLGNYENFVYLCIPAVVSDWICGGGTDLDLFAGADRDRDYFVGYDSVRGTAAEWRNLRSSGIFVVHIHDFSCYHKFTQQKVFCYFSKPNVRLPFLS